MLHIKTFICQFSSINHIQFNQNEMIACGDIQKPQYWIFHYKISIANKNNQIQKNYHDLFILFISFRSRIERSNFYDISSNYG
jgi:hypothetical protein